MNRRVRVLCIEKDTIYAQIGNRLYTGDHNGSGWQSYPLRLPRGATAYSKLHARVTRRGIHSIQVLKDKALLLIVKGALYRYDVVRERLELSFRIPRGSRPLFVCENHDGDLFWGEYFGNPKRDEVNIYVSRDQAQTWQVAYRFKKNSIRHVHGVFCDPYDNRIWITTGDKDHESAIWVTDDRFETLEKVTGGNQQSRALQLIFTDDYIYFGTDTPFKINHICRINKDTGRIEELASVDSSVYWGCKVGDHLFFSTATEPSKVNNGKYACIWSSCDGKNWKCVTKFKKDIWPMKYFQLGQIYLPQGNNTTGYLFYTPVSTESDQTLQRIRVADLSDLKVCP